MKYKYLFLILFIFFYSCGPSPEQLASTRTSIAITVIEQITADAHTASPTSKATSTTLPNTVTPALYQGASRSYLPTVKDLPQGFTLDPSSSGPLPDEGYSVAFSNPANSFIGDAFIVYYFLYVLENEPSAKESYDRYSENSISNSIGNMQSSSTNAKMINELEKVEMNIQNIDESAGYYGSFKTDTIPIASYVVKFREKNILAIVWVMGMNLAQGVNYEKLKKQAEYYVSLATDKINQ